MFSITARFRKSRTEGEPGAVYYVIREGKVQRNITGPIRAADAGVLRTARQQIVCDLKSIYCVIEHLSERSGTVTLDDVAEECRPLFQGVNPYLERINSSAEKFPIRKDLAAVGREYSSDFTPVLPAVATRNGGLSGYIDGLIYDRRLKGVNSANTLRSLQLSLNGFLDGTDVEFRNVDRRFILAYNTYLHERVAPSTVSFYMRTLRSVLNRAKNAGLTDIEFDWAANVDIRVSHICENARQTALNAAEIGKIAGLSLPPDSRISFVRDMFMFSFYAHGLELTDLANLRKANLRDGILSYRRRGKGRQVEVRLGGKALAIVAGYAHCNSDPMLFPLLKRGGKQYAFSYIRDEFSKAMKEIGTLIGATKNLTFGTSRYSWLSMAENSNIAEMLV